MFFIIIKTIIVYSFPLITLTGLVTNSLSFYIFSRTKFQNTIFSTYFRFYLLFQTLNLILPINKMFELNFDMFFSRISKLSCCFRFFYPNFNFSNSAWLLAVISIDRYLSISFSKKFSFRKKTNFQIITCCFIFAYNACFFTSSWFYYLKEYRLSINQTNNQTKPIYKCVPSGIEVDIMEMFQQIFAPFLLMILFTSLTIENVLRSRHQINNVSSIRKINIDRKFIISSITINLLFLLFNSPYFFFSFLNDYTTVFSNYNDLFKLFESLSYFFLYINLTSTFFINNCVNSMFKTELKSVSFFRTRIST